MYTRSKLITLIVAALLASASFAQDDAAQRDKEELQMIALEALRASPSERALPAILKLLDGNGSDDRQFASRRIGVVEKAIDISGRRITAVG